LSGEVEALVKNLSSLAFYYLAQCSLLDRLYKPFNDLRFTHEGIPQSWLIWMLLIRVFTILVYIV
jgi:hypothetical protein